MAQIPPKKKSSILGDSKESTLLCLNLLWKHLEKNSVLKSLYYQFMSEYKKLRHTKEVAEIEEPKVEFYFLQHVIYKSDKSITKLRVVLTCDLSLAGV